VFITDGVNCTGFVKYIIIKFQRVRIFEVVGGWRFLSISQKLTFTIDSEPLLLYSIEKSGEDGSKFDYEIAL
jgi:hypothetical protein